MFTTRLLSLLLPLIVCLQGCMQLWYKPGASGEALNVESTQCQHTTATEQAYQQCMSAQGWARHDLSIETHQPIPAVQPSAVQSTEVQPTEVAVASNTQAVGAWWKVGGNPSALMMAQKSCEPTAAQQIQWQTSASLRHCMLSKGWRYTK